MDGMIESGGKGISSAGGTLLLIENFLVFLPKGLAFRWEYLLAAATFGTTLVWLDAYAFS